MPRFFAAVALCLACAAAAAAERVLTVSWPQNVGALNPHLYSPEQMFAQDMVYEGLVRFGADGSVQPALATGWTVSDDGLVYTFTLREGVRFANGEPFDAAAVKANFDAMFANLERHRWLDLMSQIARVEAPDARTVRLVLEQPYYPALQELTLIRPVRFMAPSAFGAGGGTHDGIREPVGTGAWRLVDSVPGERDVFARNEHYWGARPAFDRVVVKVIPDPNARALALQTGEVDLVYGVGGQLSPDAFERLRAMPGFVAALSQPYEGLSLALNTARAPTDERAVRLAINHAVDKDALVASVLYGTQQRADFLFAPEVPYADVGLEPHVYDPARAETLLERAGWRRPAPGAVRERDGAPLAVDLVYVGNDAVMKSMAEVIQADLRRVGLDVALRAEEGSSVYARSRDGRFGMVFNRTWGAPYDPHAYVGSMRAPSHADYQAQRGLPDKAGLDARITRVLATTDEAERRTLYREILGTLHDEAVYLPLTRIGVMAVARRDALAEIPFGALAHEIPFAAMRPAGR